MGTDGDRKDSVALLIPVSKHVSVTSNRSLTREREGRKVRGEKGREGDWRLGITMWLISELILKKSKYTHTQAHRKQ